MVIAIIFLFMIFFISGIVLSRKLYWQRPEDHSYISYPEAAGEYYVKASYYSMAVCLSNENYYLAFTEKGFWLRSSGNEPGWGLPHCIYFFNGQLKNKLHTRFTGEVSAFKMLENSVEFNVMITDYERYRNNNTGSIKIEWPAYIENNEEIKAGFKKLFIYTIK
jgi:hypothetical protein